MAKELLALVVSPQEEDDGGGMTGMWQSVVARSNKGWKAIQLTHKAGVLNLLLTCEEMIRCKRWQRRRRSRTCSSRGWSSAAVRT